MNTSGPEWIIRPKGYGTETFVCIRVHSWLQEQNQWGKTCSSIVNV